MKSRSGLILLWLLALSLWIMWLFKRNSNVISASSVVREDTQGCKTEVLKNAENSFDKDELSGACINVNTASLEELIILPGIGKAIAQDIINYRQEKGHFHHIEDLGMVKGLGPSKLSILESRISF
ncbi:MAG TPA: ComEA family DNA-binding protein [Chitinispirillaceae bacterium]|nr:ComEA family DNA-binding protein [Chitinispirillaceae bacterium]